MKYIFFIFFIGIFLALSISCNKVEFDKEWDSNDPNPFERKGDTLNALWMVRHNQSDDGKNFSFKPVLYNDWVIASSNSLGGPELVFAIDTAERKMVWEWNDFYGKSNGERPWISSGKYDENKIISDNLICVTNKAIYALDLSSGETNHSMIFKERYFSPRFGSVQYNSLVQGLDWGETESKILLCDAGINCHTVYSEEVPLNYDIHFSHPKLDLETRIGDSLLFFGVEIRDESILTKYSDIKFIAYDISNRKMEWTFHVPPDLDAKVFSQNKVKLPLIVDNVIYFQLQTHLFCLDIETGEELWRYNYAEGTGVGSHINLIHNRGKLYYADSRGDVTCLDANTGRRLWFNSNSNETGGAVVDINLYNNRLYMTDLVSLTVVDALSGKGIGKFKSPNAKYFRDAQINVVTIDEKNEIMYVDDGYYIMACEIPGQ